MPHNRVVQMPIFEKKFFKKRKFLKIKETWFYYHVYARVCVSLYIKYILYI